jgi:sporulation protein YlmC with PRC-barrel domain
VTDEDIGKQVVNSNGKNVGKISGVRAGTAHVDVEAGITDRVRSKLGWGDTDKDDYTLREDRIGEITEDEVRLKSHR